MPTGATVVVVGGGVMGCSIAFHLAERGTDVLVLERGRSARGMTARSARWTACLLAGPHALPLPAIVSICRRAHCARYPCSGFLTPLGRGVGSGVIGLRHLAVVL
jgi:flavin-dependent dehydrogenase